MVLAVIGRIKAPESLPSNKNTEGQNPNCFLDEAWSVSEKVYKT